LDKFRGQPQFLPELRVMVPLLSGMHLSRGREEETVVREIVEEEQFEVCDDCEFLQQVFEVFGMEGELARVRDDDEAGGELPNLVEHYFFHQRPHQGRVVGSHVGQVQLGLQKGGPKREHQQSPGVLLQVFSVALGQLEDSGTLQHSLWGQL
jgi:hypothetical protein